MPTRSEFELQLAVRTREADAPIGAWATLRRVEEPNPRNVIWTSSGYTAWSSEQLTEFVSDLIFSGIVQEIRFYRRPYELIFEPRIQIAAYERDSSSGLLTATINGDVFSLAVALIESRPEDISNEMIEDELTLQFDKIVTMTHEELQRVALLEQVAQKRGREVLVHWLRGFQVARSSSTVLRRLLNFRRAGLELPKFVDR